MTMCMKVLLFSLGLGLCLASCSSTNRIEAQGSPRVTAEQFARYQTWSWSSSRTLNLRDPSRNSGQVQQILESSIASNLAQKRLTPGPASSSDLIVHYGVGSLQRVTTQNVARPGRGESSRFDHSPDPLVPTGTRDTEWEEARLLIQITDRRSGQVVYSGYGTAALLNDPSLSRAQSRINSAVRDILAGIPR